MNIISGIFGFIAWTLAIIAVVIFESKRQKEKIKITNTKGKKKRKKSDFINTDAEAAATQAFLEETEVSFVDKYEWLIVGILLLVGLILRVIWFAKIPGGINQDEASMGYDAWAVMNHGIDRNGYHLPAYLVAWSSGQSVLPMYLSMPFIKMFGLNILSVRLVNLIFGLSALPVFYLLIKRLSDKKFAIAGLMLLAFSPWHIMLSRWGLECNLLPQIFLIAVYLFVLACDKGSTKLFCSSAFMFALSMYTYAAVHAVMPVFLAAVCIVYYRKKLISMRQIVYSGIVFAVVSMPIALFYMINFLGMPEIRAAFISIPKLVYIRDAVNESNIFANIANFVKLLFKQNEGWQHNTLPYFGVMYTFSLGLFFAGIWSFIKKRRGSPRWLFVHKDGTNNLSCDSTRVRNRVLCSDAIMLIWLLSALIIVPFVSVNINRINILFIPFIYFTAEGLMLLGSQIKYGKLFVNSMIGIMLVLFCFSYFSPKYEERLSGTFHAGFEDAIRDASSREGTINLSAEINGGYVLTLFYEQIPPKRFLDTVVYPDVRYEFSPPLSFDRFVVANPQTIGTEKAVYVALKKDIGRFDPEIFEINEYEDYCAAYPK